MTDYTILSSIVVMVHFQTMTQIQKPTASLQ